LPELENPVLRSVDTEFGAPSDQVEKTDIQDRCYDFLDIFAKKFSKKLAFFTRNKAKLCKNMIITLAFEKNANYFAENWQKSQKIVIITSVPGLQESDEKINENQKISGSLHRSPEAGS
jgi:hypothetical protein